MVANAWQASLVVRGVLADLAFKPDLHELLILVVVLRNAVVLDQRLHVLLVLLVLALQAAHLVL